MGLPKEIEGVGKTRTLTKGAQKALGEFIKEYGSSEGERIYLAKASERGTGNTLRQKVNSTYKTGAKVAQRRHENISNAKKSGTGKVHRKS